MDERDADRIVSRLLQIERRLDEMDRRLTLFEGGPAAQPSVVQSPSPPPSPVAPEPSESPGESFETQWDIPTPPEPPPVLPRQATWSPPLPAGGVSRIDDDKPPPRTAASQVTGASGDELEYKIGRIGLLWAGAVVVVIGILYLVALAAARTTWTPQMRFAGDIALCAAFIVFGFIKRNEREEFGQILTGIGSFGLYATFAGGHVYLKLYSSELAVGLFVLLSLANLAYAAWRSSRSFLALGMIGGLVTAMLPMHDYNAPLDVGLHFVILVPCALIIGRNKFLDMACWLWVASTLALLPIYTFTEHLWMLRVGALYADALVCAGLYAFIHREWPFDPKCAIPFVQVVLAGVGGVAIEGVRNGSLHVLSLAAGAAAIGWGLRGQTLARNSLYGVALTVAVTLAPMGYSRTEAALVFAVLSIALSIGSLRIAAILLRSIAAVELALAACAYLGVWLTNPPLLPFGSEVAVLVAMMAAVVAGAFCAIRSGLSPDGAVAVGAATMLPLFERFGNLFLTAPSVGASPYVSAFFTTLVGFSVMYALARTRPWIATLVCCWVLYAITICAYIVAVTTGPYGFDVDVSMVGCLIAVGLLMAPLTARRLKGVEFDPSIVASGLMVGAYVVRLTYLLLEHFSNASPSSAVVVGASVWTVAAIATLWKLERKELLVVAWAGILLLLGVLWPMSQWVESGVKYEGALSLVAIGAVLAVANPTSRAVAAESKQLIIGFSGALMGMSWMRFVYLGLSTPALHFSHIHAFAAGALLTFMAIAAAYYRLRHPAMVVLAWLSTALFLVAVIPPASVLNGLFEFDRGGLYFTAPMLVAALAAPLVAVNMTAPITKERVLLTAVPVVLNWMSFTRLCLVLTDKFAMSANATVSLAWTAYAAILIGLGFGYKAPYLRYWALGVFAVVVAKVFLIDLASLDSAIRVAILLFLGLCMVGAGYAYVRWKQAAASH